MPNGRTYNKNDFIKVFNRVAKHKHRYDVFKDFVTMSAIALHNAVSKDEELEQEYLQIIRKYDKDEMQGLCELLAILVELLEPEPRDVLGGLYMELELGNNRTGQFFTPPHLSQLTAELNYGDQLKDLDKPFITLSEPACGAGGMVLAFAKVMMDHGHNPASTLWVQCIDVDRLVALMCYLQLSLWHIPAEVVVGNTLTNDVFQRLYTPAHYMGAWDLRLRYRQYEEQLTREAPETLEAIEQDNPVEEHEDTPPGTDVQFDFDF